MIRICTCISEYQDSLYGKNRRVFNECKKGSACRCTVCKKEQPLSGAEIKNKKMDKKES